MKAPGVSSSRLIPCGLPLPSRCTPLQKPELTGHAAQDGQALPHNLAGAVGDRAPWYGGWLPGLRSVSPARRIRFDDAFSSLALS